MVRSKLEMKFIGDERDRCKVFKKRVEGVKKKCHQLSLLCGIDVFFLCSPPESEKEFSPHSWPPNKPEVLRILTRYLNRSNEKIRKHPTTLSTNSSKESPRNLSYKISGKREEAKQRLEFPKGMGLVCEGASDRKIETQRTVDHSYNLWLAREMELQRSNSAYLPISYMNQCQQSQTGLCLPCDQLFWGKTQNSSSTDLGFKFIDGNMNGFGFNGSNSNNYCIHHETEEFSTCESHKTILSTDPSSSFSSVDNYSSVPLTAPSPSPSLSSNVRLPPVSDFQPHTNSPSGEFWGSDDSDDYSVDMLVRYQRKLHGIICPFLKVDESRD